jgi:hypothetical protein
MRTGQDRGLNFLATRELRNSGEGLIQWKIESGIFLPLIADVVVGKSYLSLERIEFVIEQSEITNSWRGCYARNYLSSLY